MSSTEPDASHSASARARASHLHLEVALERWEDDGGSDAPHEVATDGRKLRACMPTIPPGYAMQMEGVFHGCAGRTSYAFFRVYGPAARTPGRVMGPSRVLIEGMSFWSSSWPVTDASGGTSPAGRWLSFAHAREQLRPAPSFAEFSSVTHMRARIVGAIGPLPGSA